LIGFGGPTSTNFAAGDRLTVVDEALAVEPTFGRRCVAEADVEFAGGERIEQRQGRAPDSWTASRCPA
jgi:hypothetical protein